MSPSATSTRTTLTQAEWQARAQAHATRAQQWAQPRLERRARGESHAVGDFLFDYYPFSPAKLMAWHPGYGVALEGPAAHDYLAHSGYTQVADGVTADLGLLDGREQRLDVAIRILRGTLSRPAVTGCFALHEWAMVYQQSQDEVRHSTLPLRLAPEDIASTVESVGLRCTHIDAYRFFTPQALPLNPVEPTRATQPLLEQPGCLHAAMDLYKMTAWFLPLTSSDLLLDCFENAATARELDMRASPYDVSAFGLEAIRVETPEGRREYAEHQTALMERTDPLRQRVLADLEALRDAHDDRSGASRAGTRTPALDSAR